MLPWMRAAVGSTLCFLVQMAQPELYNLTGMALNQLPDPPFLSHFRHTLSAIQCESMVSNGAIAPDQGRAGTGMCSRAGLDNNFSVVSGNDTLPLSPYECSCYSPWW